MLGTLDVQCGGVIARHKEITIHLMVANHVLQCIAVLIRQLLLQLTYPLMMILYSFINCHMIRFCDNDILTRMNSVIDTIIVYYCIGAKQFV